MSSKKLVPKEVLEGIRKPVHRVGFVGIDDKQRKSIEDIVEQDIRKIAHQDRHKRDINEKPTLQIPTKDQPKQAPHISERPYTQFAMVQSVYYPDNEQEKKKGPPKTVQKIRQNHSLQTIPKIYVQDYDKYHRSEKKVHANYVQKDYKPKQVGLNPQKQISKEEIYRLYAQKHRSKTIPEVHDYNKDLIYPPTTKAPERVIFNTLRKEPLTNISNNYRVDYREVLSGGKRGSKYERGYYKHPYEGYSNYLEPKPMKGYFGSHSGHSYLRGVLYDPYRSFPGRFY